MQVKTDEPSLLMHIIYTYYRRYAISLPASESIKGLFVWQGTNSGSIPIRNTSLIYTSFDQLEEFLVGFHPTKRALSVFMSSRKGRSIN